MNGTDIEMEPTGERRARKWTRSVLVAALACFTLPFLTVTCYGEDVTVSGAQAATGIDLSDNDSQGEAQMAAEEPAPNVFALIALIAVAAAIVLTVIAGWHRLGTAVACAAAVAALFAFFMYATMRTTGEATPRIGLSLVIALALTAGLLQTRYAQDVPKWLSVIGGIVVAALLLGALAPPETFASTAWFLAFYAAVIVAVCLGVGAVIEVVRPFEARSNEGPSPARMTVAGLTAVAFLAVGAVGGPFTSGWIQAGLTTEIASTTTWAFTTTAISVTVAVAAWAAARAIARGPRHVRTRARHTLTDAAALGAAGGGAS
jgi:hypothetical protein